MIDISGKVGAAVRSAEEWGGGDGARKVRKGVRRVWQGERRVRRGVVG